MISGTDPLRRLRRSLLPPELVAARKIAHLCTLHSDRWLIAMAERHLGWSPSYAAMALGLAERLGWVDCVWLGSHGERWLTLRGSGLTPPERAALRTALESGR